jgi:hypothetical protein
MGPSRGEADCARRSPGDASKDAGSIPATSTHPWGAGEKPAPSRPCHVRGPFSRPAVGPRGCSGPPSSFTASALGRLPLRGPRLGARVPHAARHCPVGRSRGPPRTAVAPGFVLSWPRPRAPSRRCCGALTGSARPPAPRPMPPSGSAPAAPWLWPRPHRSTPPASRSSPESRSGPARSRWTGAPSTAHLRLCNSPGPTHRGAGRAAEFCGSRRSSSRARCLSTGQW